MIVDEVDDREKICFFNPEEEDDECDVDHTCNEPEETLVTSQELTRPDMDGSETPQVQISQDKRKYIKKVYPHEMTRRSEKDDTIHAMTTIADPTSVKEIESRDD